SPTALTPAAALLSTSMAADLATNVAIPDLLPAELKTQLVLLVGAAGAGGLSGVDSEGALRVVEAVEAVKSWADSVGLAATAAMVAEFETGFVHLAPERPSTWGWTRFVRTCRSAAAREIQVATGLPITQCQRRVWLAACEPERVAPVREAMRLGRVTLARALALTEATSHLDAFTAAVIATRVLRPLAGPDGVPLPGMAPLSQATFTARLRTQLVLAHGLVGQAERTYADGLGARRLSAEPRPDGTGLLFITGDGSRIAAAQGRVDRIARRLRKGGDGRTLAQLRADVATDLLLRGWIPSDPTFAQLGRPPAATVNVVVSLPTVLGLEAGVGQIPGWGAVSAQQARRLALQAGSIWTRIVTDPLTGRAVEATAGTYRVPAAMARQVNTRDGTCRAPGCEIPTERTDLDHSIEWTTTSGDTEGAGEPTTEGAGGPTAETNLAALHRGHHNLKTSGFWDRDQSADGAVCWTTATGRTVITYPYVYDHPDNLPIHTSALEVRHGRRLARVINPGIPLPGHFSIFDEIDWAQTLAPASPAPPPPHQWPKQLTQKQPAASIVSDHEAPPPF
ncbi:MAG TPA: hypothetical protein VFE92_16800, partial [Dermatophilaceae bacterium]|nr:hypothetical protein [Dermatophilaceae bacterium]